MLYKVKAQKVKVEHDRTSRCLWMTSEREDEASGKSQRESFAGRRRNNCGLRDRQKLVGKRT